MRPTGVMSGALAAALSLPLVAGAATLPVMAAPSATSPSKPTASAAVQVGFARTSPGGQLVIGSIRADDAHQATAVTNWLRTVPGVIGADVAIPMHRALVTTRIAPDPELKLQWGLRSMAAAESWRYTQGSGVVVAVVDDGLDRTHPDFSGSTLPGMNMVNSRSPVDAGEHGTHVAGIIAARANNAIGGAGLAPRVRILPVDVFNGDNASDIDVARGIIWAAGGHIKGVPNNRTPASIINLSLGGADSTTVLRRAVAYAVGRGVVVVAAAGNEGPRKVSYPAMYSGVVGVGAVGSNQRIAGFSSTGPQVDVVAPGIDIWSTTCVSYAGFNAATTSRTPNDCPRDPSTGQPQHTYEAMSGTSMATPFVAAAAALLKARFPRWSGTKISAELIRTARDLGKPGRDTTYGAGLIQPVVNLRGTPGASSTVTQTSSSSNSGTVTVTWGPANQPGSYGIGSWVIQTARDGDWTHAKKTVVAGTAARTVVVTEATGAFVQSRVQAVAAVTGSVGPWTTSAQIWHGDAGDTLATAAVLTGTPVRDVLSSANDVDWFKYSGSAATPNVVNLPPDAVVKVYSIVGGDKGIEIDPTVPATDFIVEVSGVSAPNSIYEVKATV